MKKFIIITSINPTTKAMKKFSEKEGRNTIIIGDKKSTDIKSTNNLEFLSIKEQEQQPYKYKRRCPYNHYVRKNIGYLYAIDNGAELIYDTDDDNIPYNTWGSPDFFCKKALDTKKTFVNIYRYYTKENIRPRGYPLDLILREDNIKTKNENNKIGIWQGLADQEPDVDAIYRLVYNKQVKFNKKGNITIPKGTYTPFNSQNTFRKKDFFEYLYLPSTVTFRFTDILRGYVAQRLIRQHNHTLGFREASVYQERNKHNLIKDFIDENPYYTRMYELVDVLNNTKLGQNKAKNIINIYKNLRKHNFVKKDEIKNLKAWLKDLEKIKNKK